MEAHAQHLASLKQQADDLAAQDKLQEAIAILDEATKRGLHALLYSRGFRFKVNDPHIVSLARFYLVRPGFIERDVIRWLEDGDRKWKASWRDGKEAKDIAKQAWHDFQQAFDIIFPHVAALKLPRRS